MRVAIEQWFTVGVKVKLQQEGGGGRGEQYELG